MMKAFVYTDWNRLEVRDVPVPEPGEGEVRIRVEACGICGSELETFRTRSPRRTPPLILGHEFSGIVDRVAAAGERPAAETLAPGVPVIVNSVISCGACDPCRRGATNLCENRQVFGMNRAGAAAGYVVAPAGFVYPRPSRLAGIPAALAEPAANAVHVAGLLGDAHSPSVLLFGAGPIGLMILQVLRSRLDARVAVVDKKPARLEVASSLGAEVTVQADREDLADKTAALRRSDGFEFSVDAVGSAATKDLSLRCLATGGTAIWIGLSDDLSSVSSYAIVLKERKVIGSYSAVRGDFETAMHMLAQGTVGGGPWVKVFPLAEAVSAFERMLRAEGDDIKAVLLPPQ